MIGEYSIFHKEADRQYTSLWAHMAYRAGHDILRAHGYDLEKNNKELYRDHCLEAFLANERQADMFSPPS